MSTCKILNNVNWMAQIASGNVLEMNLKKKTRIIIDIMTSQHKYLTSRHQDMTRRHNYFTSVGRTNVYFDFILLLPVLT